MTKQEKNIESLYPLSPMQQGMLFHTLLSPKSGAYFTQMLYTLTGAVEEAALRCAWQRVMERHEPFRTLFVWEGQEKPLQVVRRRVALPWRELDWRGLPAEEQTVKLEELLQADRRRGFDLAEAPLMRLTLIRMEETRCELLWSQHHLLIDGWSSFLVLKEVVEVYEAVSQGGECALEPARPYRAYINWLQKQDLTKAEGYWRAALKGFTAPTSLWGNRVKEGRADQDYEVAEQLVRSSSSLLTALRSFGGRHGLTLSTLVQGAWALLLSRYSGEGDVVFGSTVSGRPAELAGVESMVGLFINTLAVRARFSSQDLVLAWLKDFQNQLVELRQYEYSPLVEVQGWSEVRRDQPLFESLLVFENYPVDASIWEQRGALRISNIRARERGNYPLTVVVMPRKELAIKVQYDARRFDAAAIARMLGHFITLLQGIVATPDRRLLDLPLLTGAERQQLLEEWNPDHAEDCLAGCIHQLFEKQVERSPDAVAVVYEDEKLTYGELNRRSNQLAHVLRRMGVGPETLVGVYMERSLEMVIGILGIVKAGGAYLPLDPVYPPERLAFMLEDARPKAVLTQQRLLDSLPRDGITILPLDTERERLCSESVANLDKGAQLDDLAYVIYTSGSTGKPKGTLVTHRNVARLFQATQEWFGFGAQDVWTLFHSPAFDFSVWELWGALACGGRLVVVPYLVSRSPDAFYELLSNQRVTVLNQTPSAFRQLIEAEAVARTTLPLALRLVIFGGEALEMQSLKPWFDRHGDQCPQLVNMYGITETTVHVTYRPLTSADVKSGSVIGIPIPDLKVYILDRNRQLAPIGVPGELYVGGAGVARGYLNRPELTAEKFVVNPFTAKQGDRLYRSGDLARYLPSRDLEYLGRMDDQVKIRGFRIELGEIESVLAGLAGVREAVVVAREDVSGDKRLAAYLTANGGDLPKVSELRSLLQAKLPEYMVPSAFVTLDKFPLTPNGKVDRKALPRPELQSEPAGFMPPVTATEKALAEIWGEILGIKQVGLHDNFFELGGHSLQTLRVITAIHKQLGKTVAVASLFTAPTIFQLSRLLDENGNVAVVTLSDGLRGKGAGAPLFYIPGMEGYEFLPRALARHLNEGCRYYDGLQYPGLNGNEPMPGSVEEIAAYLIPQIQRISPHGPYYLTGWSFGGVIAFEVARQLEARGVKDQLVLLLDSYCPGRGLRKRSTVEIVDLFQRHLSTLNRMERAVFLRDLAINKLRFLLSSMKRPLRSKSKEGPTPLMQAARQAARKYHPGCYGGRVVLFQIEDWEFYGGFRFAPNPTFGWGELVRGGLEIIRVPGDHISMMNEPAVSKVAERILNRLVQREGEQTIAWSRAGSRPALNPA